ncbi:MAG: hypothetical protein QM813_03650 [Verrucomicrobiota bacterium]
MRFLALICLLGLATNIAHAHDPYEITSVAYVRSNVIELFIEMEFPAGMRLAGVEPVRDVAVLSQFEKAQPQLTALAGSFFDFTAGNNRVAALTTNVSLGVEDHIQFKLEYVATPLRPLQFTARGLRSGTDSPYGTSLTVLDMVNQKVLGQTTLFADSARAEFPPSPPETDKSSPAGTPDNASPIPSVTNAASLPPAIAPVRKPAPPSPAVLLPGYLLMLVFLGAVFLMVFALFRHRK